MGMSKTVRLTAGLVAAGLVAAGCGTARPSGPQAPAAVRGVVFREPAVSPRPYGAADTAFGMDVLGAWCQADPHANVVLSPASLATSLGMAYLGARGATAKAMAGVLHLPAATGQRLEAGLQARSAALRGLDGPGVTVAQSDQVWADPSLVTRKSYLNAVATGYDAGVRHVPVLHRPALAAQEIDNAIAAATRGHITGLLSPQSLAGIGWVLTDALYLHAAWARPFAASDTSPAPFASAAGPRVTAQFMHGGPFRTTQADGWTAVSLPYQGGKLAMLALLPPPGAGACPTVSAGAMKALSGGLAAPVGGKRLIALPRVSLSSKLKMNGLLGTLGMGQAFGPGADFAGLSPQACCIGLVEHAATLKVGEKGTVASAATATGLEPTAAQAPQARIWFNRPYLLMVTDRATGEPLFLARVANPTAH
jgi:serine protease inhibitor